MKKSIYAVVVAIIVIVGGIFWYTQETSHKTEKTVSAKVSKSSTSSTIKETIESTEPKKIPKITLPVTDNQELDAFLNEQHFSGTALVVRKGKVILNQSYGMADQAKQIKNTPTTRYYIGSAQKAIIATAILQLEQAGKLSINDPIAKYLANFPNGQQITLKNLLNHTSGLTGRKEGSEQVLPQKIVEEIEAAGSDSAIGTWHYSDSNYAVLAYLVQQLSHQSIAEYVQANIFKPANMQDSGFYQRTDPIANLAESYKEKNGQVEQVELPDLSQLFGAGDIYTTATDFYLFDQALMQGKLINQAEREKMLTAGSESTYGMGFYVNPGSYSSHGVLGGFNTINTFTHTGLTEIILLANTNQVASLGQAADHIYEVLNQME